MTTLPLKFYEEADIWAENFPETVKLDCKLNYLLETRYQRGDPNEEKIKKQLAKTFQNELYGPIKDKLAEAQSFFFRKLSTHEDVEKCKKLFDKIYAAIPQVTA